ncbi:MAG TPA: hypothetical protein VKY70_01650 [Pseudomonas sp.]|jgi:hypothetical protein|nr:hypothetical protein [Pseudomonas sp.]
MSRHAWSHAYQLIEPDEQLDLFACREARVHIVARQLELAGRSDHTLCGSLLPAHPDFRSVEASDLCDARLCPQCKAMLKAHRQGRWHAVELSW